MWQHRKELSRKPSKRPSRIQRAYPSAQDIPQLAAVGQSGVGVGGRVAPILKGFAMLF